MPWTPGPGCYADLERPPTAAAQAARTALTALELKTKPPWMAQAERTGEHAHRQDVKMSASTDAWEQVFTSSARSFGLVSNSEWYEKDARPRVLSSSEQLSRERRGPQWVLK